MTRKDPFDLVGAVLKGYRIDDFVGEDSLGAAYKAFHTAFDKPAALKILKLQGRWTDEERAVHDDTFRAEGKILRALSDEHPAFVQIWDLGFIDINDQPTPYLVMEWLDGESLEGYLERRHSAQLGGRPLADVIARLAPIAQALGIAHAQDPPIVHRDVKPANVFMARTAKGTKVKLLGFGIAQLTADAGPASRRIQPGAQAARAFRYAAPEHWEPAHYGGAGPWTDVYALALVCVEMLGEGAALLGESAEELIAATVDAAQRPTPRARGVELSDDVEAVFAKALAVDPTHRFRDAKAFWSALTDAAGLDRGSDIAPESTRFRAGTGSDAGPESWQIAPESRRMSAPIAPPPNAVASLDANATEGNSGPHSQRMRPVGATRGPASRRAIAQQRDIAPDSRSAAGPPPLGRLTQVVREDASSQPAAVLPVARSIAPPPRFIVSSRPVARPTRVATKIAVALVIAAAAAGGSAYVLRLRARAAESGEPAADATELLDAAPSPAVPSPSGLASAAVGSVKDAGATDGGPVPLKEFDRKVAMAALKAPAVVARQCHHGDGSVERSKVTITFATAGNVIGIDIDGALRGTSAGGCMAAALVNARVPPFTGARGIVTKMINTH